MPCSVEAKLWVRGGDATADTAGRLVTDGCTDGDTDGDGVTAWPAPQPAVAIPIRAAPTTPNLAEAVMAGGGSLASFRGAPPAPVLATCEDAVVEQDRVCTHVQRT